MHKIELAEAQEAFEDVDIVIPSADRDAVPLVAAYLLETSRRGRKTVFPAIFENANGRLSKGEALGRGEVFHWTPETHEACASLLAALERGEVALEPDDGPPSNPSLDDELPSDPFDPVKNFLGEEPAKPAAPPEPESPRGDSPPAPFEDLPPKG